MFNRLRVWRLVGVCAALMLGTLVTAPIVAAAKPDRVVLGLLHPFVVPAGFGCAFDVHVEPVDGTRTFITFADGRHFTKFKGHAVFSNVVSGSTFEHHAAFQAVDTYDPITNQIRAITHGQASVFLFPGDVGPYGVVSEPGLILRFTGTNDMTFDADTFQVTAFSYVGRVNDICAELSA